MAKKRRGLGCGRKVPESCGTATTKPFRLDHACNSTLKAKAIKPFVSLQEWLIIRRIPASWDLSTATSYRLLHRCNVRNLRAAEIASEAGRKRGEIGELLPNATNSK